MSLTVDCRKVYNTYQIIIVKVAYMDKYLDLLITLGFLGALMWGMMKFMLRDIHKDLADLKIDLHEFKEEVKQSSVRHEKRIDDLYQICINLLKDRK